MVQQQGVNPIQDGHFRGCSRMGGGLKSYSGEIWHSYSLPKENPKNK